ncbi:hypothetical protein [Planomicrobium sp. CPCC 101110]|uniref:hypothetical protein n=1 Tax=Planomicrobium sp. CPCC 101110 TaxID=2599619 RepID=UPI0011B4BCE2|nr:hypothetical protein [Planomicrobium sp. CPCC 101110]TWT27743.1 hypothetical protein FQV30_04315 [Planomicrobium sp. CPCC 101110]
MEDSPVEEHGIEYIKVLVDLKMQGDYQGEKESYEGLVVMYITEYDNEYGYLIEDDMDYLNEEQAEQIYETK